MEETGIVKKIDGLKAFVSVQRQSSCDQCSAGSVCKGTGDNDTEVEALNQANAHTGDTVRIVFKPYSYMKGAALVYGVPSLLLIIGAVIGKEYSGKIFADANPDVISAITGFGFFGISFVVIKLLAGRFEGKTEYMPVIEEIIH